MTPSKKGNQNGEIFSSKAGIENQSHEEQFSVLNNSKADEFDTDNGSDEIFAILSVQAPIVVSESLSETEIFDSINKPEDLSVALFDAIETHEEDALHQEIAKGNEIDKCTDRVGSKIEQINQTKIRD